MSRMTSAALRLLPVCALLFVLNAPAAALAGRVAWWKLDETGGTTAADSSGSANNGTVSGTPNWGPGQVNNALTFANDPTVAGASQNFVSIPNSASLNPTATISAAAWFKTTQPTPNGYAVSILRHDTHFTPLQLRGDGVSGQVVLWAAGGGTFDPVTFPWTYNDGRWHHYAVTYTPGALNIYVDGVVVKNDTTRNYQLAAATNVAFAMAGDGGGGEGYTGSLDEVQIFNRALTVAEVRGLAAKPPTLKSVLAPAATTVNVVFDLPVSAVTAQVAGNYVITNGGGGNVAITGAVLNADGVSVALTTAAMLPGLTYTLAVSNVKESTGTYTIAANTTANFSPFVVPNGTAAWWKLDETSGALATDSSGNGNTGVVNGTPNWGPGKLGNAGTFTNDPTVPNDSGNYINAGDAATLNPTAAISVTAWFKTTQVAPGTASVSVLRHDGHFTALQLWPGGTQGQIALWPADGTAYQSVVFPWTYNDGAWHHYAVVHQSGVGVNVYVDGVNVGSDTTKTFALHATNSNFQIASDGGAEGYAGSLDEVMVFNRALTQTEVQAMVSAAIPPALTGLSPMSGANAGGQPVIITGSALLGVTAVTFGGTPGTITGQTDTQITVTTPAHAGGAVDVVAVKNGLTATLAGIFTYVAPPHISSILPVSGPQAGGQNVTITGTDLGNATSVTFGGAAATIVTNSATQIVATTPAHAPGLVSVVVVAPGGTATSANAYTYVAAPTITSVTPNTGSGNGGNSVTIAGTNLGNASVTFGGVTATVMSNTAVQIVVVTIPRAGGVVDVVVTTPGGSVTSAGAFSYIGPIISNVNPAVGPALAGTTVTITGQYLNGAVMVTFGSAAATITSDTASTLVVTAPPKLAGAVDIVITTANGSATAAGGFYYDAPPSVISGPTVTPNPAFVNRPVTLALTTTDPENEQVTVTCNWGDGTTNTASQHTYTVAATYTVTVTLSDGITTAAPGGTNELIVNTIPAFTLTKVSGAFKFNNPKPTDSASATGTLPNLPKGQKFLGKHFTVDVGGAKADCVLDAKGKGKGLNNSTVALKLKFGKDKQFIGGPVTFTAKTKGIFAATWHDEGVDPAVTLTKQPLPINVDVTFDTGIWTGTLTPLWTVKAGKSGSFK